MKKLAGKVAIVTGAARGLGRAYALKLASLGAKVACCDLDLRSYAEFEAERQAMRAETVVDEIIEGGVDALGFEFDVSDRDATFAMVEDVARSWGRADVLVANAGGGRGTPAETTATLVSSDLLEQVTGMNLYGTVYSCSGVAPLMKEQRSGKIITVASYAALETSRDGGYAHYGANKAAIAHYTRYLAQELGPYNVTANCIAPGLIQTARIAEMTRSNQELGDFALRRAGTPEDCARVIEFFATELSDYVTGTVLPVDGGWKPRN
ncbi:MAG: SDR family NAD(P)-dependent oxidoreductase [Acidimicrobiales bacterium]